MATMFSTEFDGTDGAAANLTTENPTSATSNALTNRTGPAGWFYETSSKASGTASIHCVNTSPDTSTWTYTHSAGGVTTHYYDICFKVTALPAGDTMIVQLRLGGTNKAQVELRADGTIRIKNATTAVGTSAAGTVVANQWLRIKWGISGSNQELRIYTNATPANLFGTSPDEVLGAGAPSNYGGGAWDQFRFGVMSAQNMEIWFDRMVVDNSTWPNSGGSGNVTPVADAGPDIDTYEGGDVITLDGTGSTDSDGTITDYAWTQTSGPVVALSDATDPQPTFTAPATAGIAVFALRVTDDGGAQSTPDSVTIEWAAAPTADPTSDFYEKLLGGADGVTVTDINSDFDSVSAGVTYMVPAPIGTGIGAMDYTGSGAVKVGTHILPAGLVNKRYTDWICVIDDLSVGPWYICRALSGTTLQASVRVNTNGTVQARNGATAVNPAIGNVVAGEPFRVAWMLDFTNTRQDLRVYHGANLFGTSPTAEAVDMNYDQGTFDRFGWGIAAPAVASGHAVTLIPQVEATDWPTPFGGSVATLSNLYFIETDGTFTPVTLDKL